MDGWDDEMDHHLERMKVGLYVHLSGCSDVERHDVHRTMLFVHLLRFIVLCDIQAIVPQ